MDTVSCSSCAWYEEGRCVENSGFHDVLPTDWCSRHVQAEIDDNIIDLVAYYANEGAFNDGPL